jgi:6,7-dimethyl-8-ribityllumazine synthase
MIAIVKADFNQEITGPLLKGCVDYLKEQHAPYELWEVPGAVETVALSKKLMDTGSYKSIIVLGAIVKGDTDHYEYVCNFVTHGIATLSASAHIPVVFGILTTQTEELALERALPERMNKGAEFAETALTMMGLFAKI